MVLIELLLSHFECIRWYKMYKTQDSQKSNKLKKQPKPRANLYTTNRAFTLIERFGQKIALVVASCCHTNIAVFVFPKAVAHAHIKIQIKPW